MLTKEEIIRVLYDSNFWGKEQEVGIVREEYLEKLIKIKDMEESICISGVRRCGKSTISKQFLKQIIEKGVKKENTLYVNFEEPAFTPYLNSNILDIIYNTYSEVVNPEEFAYIVLDEVQNVLDWEKWVRAKQEKGKAKIIVTGSSSKLMSSEFSTVLGGRSININIFPLSFKEFIKFKGKTIKHYKGIVTDKNLIHSLLREYLEFGGFPRVVMEKKENKGMLLKEYFDSIIFRDVVSRYNVRDVNLLKTLAIIMQTNISSPSSIGKLGNILQDSFKRKTSLETVSRFLEYFESAFLIFTIPIFSYKINDQLQYPRKIYTVDTGLRNAVSFRFSEDLGKLYENVVFLELKRKGKEIYYWKDNKQREVDFVIKEGIKVNELIQVCFDTENEKTKKREIDALIRAMDEFGIDNGTIITEDYKKEEIFNGKKIKSIPLWEWLF